MVSWPEGSPYPSASPSCQGGAVSACPSSCRPASRCGPRSRPLSFPRASVPHHARRGGSCPGHSPWGARFPSRSILQQPPAVVSSGLDPGLWEVGERSTPVATSRRRGAARRMLSAAGHVLAIGRCQPLPSVSGPGAPWRPRPLLCTWQRRSRLCVCPRRPPAPRLRGLLQVSWWRQLERSLLFPGP